MSCQKCGGCGYVKQNGCEVEDVCGCVDAFAKESLSLEFGVFLYVSSGEDVFSKAAERAFKESLPEGVEFHRGDLLLRSGFEIIPNRKTPVPDVLAFLRAGAAVGGNQPQTH